MLLDRFMATAYAPEVKPDDDESCMVYSCTSQSEPSKRLHRKRRPQRQRKRPRPPLGSCLRPAVAHDKPDAPKSADGEATEESTSGWGLIHPALLCRIAEECDNDTVSAMRCVCKHWQRVLDEDMLSHFVLFNRNHCSNQRAGAAVMGTLERASGAPHPDQAWMLEILEALIILKNSLHRFSKFSTHHWYGLFGSMPQLRQLVVHQPEHKDPAIAISNLDVWRLRALTSLELNGPPADDHINELALFSICLHLTDLLDLRLRGVLLESSAFDGFRHLPKLTALVLTCVAVSAQGQESIQCLSMLRNLRLLVVPNLPAWGSQAVAEVAQLTRLTHLNIAQDPPLMLDLTPVSTLTALQHLNMRGHDLPLQRAAAPDAPFPSYRFLSNLTGLTHLDASYTTVPRLEAVHFENMRKLKSLNIRSMALKRRKMRQILDKCPSLETVHVWAYGLLGAQFKIQVYMCLQLKEVDILRIRKRRASAQGRLRCRVEPGESVVVNMSAPSCVDSDTSSEASLNYWAHGAEVEQVDSQALSEEEIRSVLRCNKTLGNVFERFYQWCRFFLRRPVEASILGCVGTVDIVLRILLHTLVVITLIIGAALFCFLYTIIYLIQQVWRAISRLFVE